MNYLFTELYPLWNYHYVTELNLMQKYINSGDEVWITQCAADLKNCECNYKHELAHCLRCMGIANDGLSFIEGNYTKIPLIQSAYQNRFPKDFPIQFQSIDHLKNYFLEEFDIGMAVYSCLLDRTHSSEPDIRSNKKIIDDLFLDAWRVWESAKSILSRNHFDKVYIFNGRFTAARAWVRACQKNKTEFSSHERLSSLRHAYISENTVIHDNDQFAEAIEAFWDENGEKAEIIAEGIDFFEERPLGKVSGWISHSESQNRNVLPDSWNPEIRNIIIFTSSEHELLGVAENYRGWIYKDQMTAYKDVISKTYQLDNNIKFYIRVHPGSLNQNIRWWEDNKITKIGNVEIIPPDSLISSYDLMFASEKCITFQSTMGVEAAYWGKPSLILEKTFYYGIDCGYYFTNHQDIYDWVIGKPECKPKINAIKFGAFMRCAGEKLTYSEPVNFYTLQFKGKTLEARREVHEWLGDCEKRPAVKGIKKWLQDRKDKKRFNQIIKDCGGDLAASSRAD